MEPAAPFLTAPRPHDLLLIADPLAVLTGDEPAWVRPAVTAVPWVVVRRAAAPEGHAPVGVRGSARSERHALNLPLDMIADVVRPEDLRPRPGTARTAAIVALRTADPVLTSFGHPWGPTGSAGFELASGAPTTTQASDLDLIIRVPAVPTRDCAAALLDRLSALPTRVDCQLETSHGAVALAELAMTTEQVVFRTPNGPQLGARTAAQSS
jgi:phosphoribosyl-dephospho-CoA transferase